MVTSRVFLGWDRPVLPAAADWLLREHGRDLSRVTVVVAARRAGRRLEQLLLGREPVLGRPEVLSVGGLAELPVRAAGPEAVGGEVADGLDAGLAWVSVLRDFAGGDAERLAALVPDPPGADDFAGWWALAARLTGLREQLAAGRKTLRDASGLAQGSGPRWAVLASLEEAYLATLAQRGKVDRHVARERALALTELTEPVVVLAAADLTPLQSAVLDIAKHATALVFADESESAGFDAHGGLVTGYWETRGLNADDAALRVVEHRGDQPDVVARSIEAAAAGRSEADVSVALGEEALGPAVVRAIESAGGTARTAAGRALRESGPGTLWAALARYVETRRFDALAALLRHPDLEFYLERTEQETLPSVDGHVTRDAGAHEAKAVERTSVTTGVAAWQTLLDVYVTESLQAEQTGDWLASEQIVRPLKRVHDRVAALLPVPSDEVRPMPAWSGVLKDALRRVYHGRGFDPLDAADAEASLALTKLASLLDDQALLAASRDDVPGMTVAQAMRWTLARLGGDRATDPPTAGGIEVMGLLDAALDDAPVGVVTSLNEGHIPGAVADVAGGLLPGALRSALGLPDARRRLARDTFLLAALTRSRTALTLIAARYGDDGEPLKPSRVWLHGGDAHRSARRLKRFYGESAAAGTEQAGAGPVPGGRNRFVIPRPVGVPTIEHLSVTALRGYLACPYRFYLRHVLSLRQVNDAAVELDAMAFGTLVHDVLAAYGLGDGAPRQAGDAGLIEVFFSEALDAEVLCKFGREPRAAVRVQAEFARERLAEFAKTQARWNREGWEVVEAEHDLERAYERDAGALMLRGRIDRIDRHPELGLRVIDFKTGDNAKPPGPAHVTTKRDGSRRWHDLQLPVYRDLLEAAGLVGGGDGPIDFGYVVLPRKREEVAWHALDWDDATWRSARDERDRVLDGILRHDFKPSEETPRFDDGLAGVCADAWADRAADLARWGVADA